MEENTQVRINNKTVVVADGSFPVHDIPLSFIRRAARLVCCDGSAANLIAAGFIPEAIVGDMDSLNDEMKKSFADRIHYDNNQGTNDLTKAVDWCSGMGYNDIVVVGATGKREDHTIGNISLLAEYAVKVNITMITDTGIFLPYLKSSLISTFPGQQVSIFSIDPETEITSVGLKYPLNKTKVKNWWVATLNEASGEKFSLDFRDGRVIVFLKFGE